MAALEKKAWFTVPGEHVYNGLIFSSYQPRAALEKIRTFPLREDDVFVVAYPKSGTTWMQEIVWNIIHHAEEETKVPKNVRMPFMEYLNDAGKTGVDVAHELASPRILKSHLAPAMMPLDVFKKKCKVVICIRNPKDVAVSFSHFYGMNKILGNFPGPWDEFFEMMLADHVIYGSWSEHTRLWWEMRNQPNISISFYEDLKQNPVGSVAKIAKFLGKDLDEDKVRKIVAKCDFDKMSKNPLVNGEDNSRFDFKISRFLRKGEVGDWKTHFTVAQSEAFDEKIASEMTGVTLPIKYEL